ncbi:hypothetical protein RRG08_021195 [Elysia crispata]|uniref:Uncharacterized protein n=1 Tax=Elysia crispata TaxID=231223 RepID=A0AAE1D1Z3_9GAST|nr:hypothetical protein RRG08_021195 [Elysia crispata]
MFVKFFTLLKIIRFWLGATARSTGRARLDVDLAPLVTLTATPTILWGFAGTRGHHWEKLQLRIILCPVGSCQAAPYPTWR